jgi:hypothetical protein
LLVVNKPFLNGREKRIVEAENSISSWDDESDEEL